MNDERLAEPEIAIERDRLPRVPRRHLLTLAGLLLLPAAAVGLSSCGSPQYDPDRGVFVMRPRK